MASPTMKYSLVLLVVCRIHAVLDYSTIKESLKWRSCSGSRVNEKGLLNPLLGFLLEYNGVVHNMRFLSPNIHTHCSLETANDKKVCRRLYENDRPASSKDSFHRILLTFFPSTEGRVSICLGRSNRTFLDTLLKNCSRSTAICMLSVLTALSLGGKVEYRTTDAGCVTIQDAPTGVEIQKDKVHMAAEIMAFFSREDVSAEKKAILLQNFIFHFLNTREEIEMFFSHVHSFVKGKESTCFLSSDDTDGGVDCTLLDEIVKAAQFSPHIVWFAPKGTKPPLHAHTEGQSTARSRFSFSAEMVLLGLICNLLYDAENARYSAEHLGNGAERMKDFFARASVQSTAPVTEETAARWLRIVRDIRDSSVLYSKAVSKCGTARKVLVPGLVNLLMVLRSVCGVDWAPGAEWSKSNKKPHSYGEIRDAFESAFAYTLSRICTRKLSCEFKDTRARRMPNSSTWEVFGTVAISIPSANGIHSTVEVTHTEKGADYVFFVSPFAWCEQNVSRVVRKTDEYAKSSSMLVSLMGTCVQLYMLHKVRPNFFYETNAQLLDNGSVEDVFFQGGIYTDRMKIMLLDLLFSQRHKKKKALHQLERNIVASLEMREEAVCDVVFLLVSFRKPLAEFTKILPREWSRRRKPNALQRLVQQECINLVCYCIDKKETWLHRKAFFADAMECPLIDLVSLLIKHKRRGTIERLLERYEWRMHEIMRTGLVVAMKTHNMEYVHYFFERISKTDLEQFEYSVYLQDMSDYLVGLALERGTSSSVLEKVYCWYFCDSTGMFCMDDLYEVVESTYTRMDMDFIYDCMVKRCPRYYNFMKFHKLFLELAIRDRVKVRSDALVLIRVLARSIDTNPCYIILDRKPIKVNKLNMSGQLRKELLDAISEVERLGLVYGASFDEHRYVSFLNKHAADFANRDGPRQYKKHHRGFREDYTMEIRRIFGER